MARKRDLTIEPTTDGTEFMVVEHSVYERTSVLAGQAKRSRLDYFPTVKEAQMAYPNAQVMEHQTGDPFARIYDDNPTPHVTPSWFDPLDAGEVWHEDDY